MKTNRLTPLALLILLVVSPYTVADEKDGLELETTRIKANKELPQVLYIVPWQDFNAPETEQRQLKLHDFFGDLYEPLLVPKSSQTAQEAD